MDLSDLTNTLQQIENNEFGLNRILINLILQIFLKNNITEADDIMISISQYLDLEPNAPLIHIIANNLSIMFVDDKWIWVS